MNSEDRIIKARAKLMKGNVGMATMLLNLELIEASERCETMATDGVNIYWNDEFVKTLTDEEIQAVLVHEASHVIWEHPLRLAKRNHMIWNIATDYVINAWISYDLSMELPKDGLLDRVYHGKSAEQVYRILTNDDDALKNAMEEMESKSEDDSKDESESDTSSSNSGNGEEESEEESEGKSESSDGNASGKSLMDELADMKPSMGEVWMPTDEDGKELSDADISEIREKIERTLVLANKLEGVSNDGSSNLGGVMKNLSQCNVDWKEALKDLLTSAISNNPTWSRLNKRHSWRGVNLPSHDKEPHGGEIVVAVDTSGSVTQDELNIFATEIQNLCDECGIEKIRVCYCDTSVRKNTSGEWWDEFELADGELELTYRGGGGTRFDPPFNLFNDYTEDTEDVIAFLYFTDGFADVSPDVEPDVPVIWALSEDSNSYYGKHYHDYPFGEKVYIDMTSL
jgi:predicted metal-dependent peptidase